MSSLKVTDIPEWLSSTFILHDLLNISENAEIESFQYACKKDESFASNIFRIKISYRNGGSQTIILKARPFNESSFREDFLKKFNIFPKEIEMYDMIARFEQILNEVGIKSGFGAK